MHFNTIIKTTTTAIAGLLMAGNAFAGGFEKNIMWGGKSAGTAGIATPWISGGDAVYFNPAGLALDEPGKNVSLNASPTWSQFSGPIKYNNEVSTGDRMMTVPGALTYGQSVGKNCGIGVGYYASGGSKSKFENQQMTTGAMNSTVKTDLEITELGLGSAYKLNEQWKFGATLRYVMVKGDFAFVQPTAAAGVPHLNLELNGLKGNAFGYKLGAQYKASAKTRYSFVYRSEVNAAIDGNYGGNVWVGASTPISQTPATLRTTFPMAATLGAQHDYEKWRALVEYVWTQYSRIGEIPISGSFTFVTPGPTTNTIAGVNSPTNWRDEHSFRLGGEYLGMAWPVRFGYLLASPVTNKNYARANFVAPGWGHSVTLGTGKDFDVAQKPLSFNVAGEYVMVNGDGEGEAAGVAMNSGGGYTRSGAYTTNAYALHMGLAYAF